MPRKDERGPRWRLLHAPDTNDSVAAWVQRYLEAMKVMGRTKAALNGRTSTLARFNEHAVHGLAAPFQVGDDVEQRARLLLGIDGAELRNEQFAGYFEASQIGRDGRLG